MKPVGNWLRDILSQTISRTLAGILVGFALAAIAGISSFGLAAFLRQQVTVPTSLLLALSLFALVGLFAGALPLWRLVTAARRTSTTQPVDEALEQTTSQLLAQLAEVEAGKQIYVEHAQKDFKAKTMTLFDAWETRVQRSLPPADHDEVAALRTEITSRSLQHSAPQAKQWIAKVKALTQKARARGR